MKLIHKFLYIIVFIAALVYFSCDEDASGGGGASITAQWARSVSTGIGYSRFNSVAVDSSGNVYAAGYISGTETYTFGTGVTATGSGSNWNAVLVKYDASGTAQWASTVSTGTSSIFSSVAIDRTGNVYAAGYVEGTETYTFGTGVTATGSGNSDNVVLVKYDASGTAQWASTVSTGTSYSRFNSVAVDRTGNVYAAGYISGTETYTFGTDVTETGSASGQNVVLVKYDAGGTAQWARSVSTGISYSRFNSVAVDGTGNVYAAGSISETETYTFGTDVSATGSSSSGNVVLVKYDAGGTAQWASTVVTGTGYSYFGSVAVDTSGNVYAAGFINGTGTYTFSTDVTATGSGTGGNVVLVKYNASGTALWARTVAGGTEESRFNSAAVDSNGDVYAAGVINGTGTYSFSTDVTATGSGIHLNVVLVKYDAGGTAHWARSVTTGANSCLNSVAIDSTGNVYAAGYISGTETYTFGAGVTATGPSSNDNVVLVRY